MVAHGGVSRPGVLLTELFETIRGKPPDTISSASRASGDGFARCGPRVLLTVFISSNSLQDFNFSDALLSAI